MNDWLWFFSVSFLTDRHWPRKQVLIFLVFAVAFMMLQHAAYLVDCGYSTLFSNSCSFMETLTESWPTKKWPEMIDVSSNPDPLINLQLIFHVFAFLLSPDGYRGLNGGPWGSQSDEWKNIDSLNSYVEQNCLHNLCHQIVLATRKLLWLNYWKLDFFFFLQLLNHELYTFFFFFAGGTGDYLCTTLFLSHNISTQL